jgi:hypothetical protein
METPEISDIGKVEAAPVQNESTAISTTATSPVVKRKTMSLTSQIQYIKKNFQSEEGYLITLVIKQITQTQAIIHGKVFHMKHNRDDQLAYEGSLIHPIKDQSNFVNAQYVIALNIGKESLAQRLESMFKNNTSNAIGTIVQVFTNIGFRIGG